MKKIEKFLLTRLSVIEDIGHLVKYSTQVENVFIYDVKIGKQHQTRIFKEQMDEQSPIYGEKSVVVTHNDFVAGYGLCGGVEYIGYTKGLENKYKVNGYQKL